MPGMAIHEESSAARQNPGLEQDSSFNTLVARSQKNGGRQYQSREALANLQKKVAMPASPGSVEGRGVLPKHELHASAEKGRRPISFAEGQTDGLPDGGVDPGQDAIQDGQRARSNHGTRERLHQQMLTTAAAGKQGGGATPGYATVQASN